MVTHEDVKALAQIVAELAADVANHVDPETPPGPEKYPLVHRACELRDRVGNPTEEVVCE